MHFKTIQDVMLTAGLSNFDNESATNFIADIDMNGYGMIEIAITRMNDEDDRPGLAECEEALIAAELIAAANGHPAHDISEDAREWILLHLPAGSVELAEILQLVNIAADAIDTIVTDSELRDLWEGNPDFDEWFNLQVDLQKRLLGEE